MFTGIKYAGQNTDGVLSIRHILVKVYAVNHEFKKKIKSINLY